MVFVAVSEVDMALKSNLMCGVVCLLGAPIGFDLILDDCGNRGGCNPV
jgi:hypothetical protein